MYPDEVTTSGSVLVATNSLSLGRSIRGPCIQASCHSQYYNTVIALHQQAVYNAVSLPAVESARLEEMINLFLKSNKRKEYCDVPHNQLHAY